MMFLFVTIVKNEFWKPNEQASNFFPLESNYTLKYNLLITVKMCYVKCQTPYKIAATKFAADIQD